MIVMELPDQRNGRSPRCQLHLRQFVIPSFSDGDDISNLQTDNGGEVDD